MAPWLGELARLVPDLIRSYLPFAPMDARSRERVILAITEVNGSRSSAWVHGGWQAFLGATDPTDADEAVLAFARACAVAGHPVDPGALGATLPAAAIRSLRATVAQIELSTLVGNTAEGLLARATGKRPRAPLRAARELVTVGLALPFAVPMVAISSAMRLADRWAPGVPTVEIADVDEANLLVHLLAQAVPSYLGHAGLRTAVLGLPFTVAIGIRSGRTSATLRFGRGAVSVANGIHGDALVLIDGDVEPLLRAASVAIVSELRSMRLRPS
ncbi:MAG: hypothetical protein M3Z46_06745 [Actinomycetota bacterium]|nr:hypothetical protein [Actinomycetota bacterium]